MLIENIWQNTLQGNTDYLRTKNPKSRKYKEKSEILQEIQVCKDKEEFDGFSFNSAHHSF